MTRVHRIELLAVIGLALTVGCRSADVTAATNQGRNAPPQYTPVPAGEPQQPAGPSVHMAAQPPAEAPGAREAAAVDGAGTAQAVVPPEKQAKLQFYIMSQCPFGVQVLDGVIPALRQIGPWVDFKVDFIGGIAGDQLTSMHGENEVAGDIVELCTIQHAPAKWMDMFSCWDKDIGAFPGNWRDCATQSQLDAPAIERVAACTDGPEGKALLKASFEKAQQAGATGSPTIFLNGTPWRGGRDEHAFLVGICNALGEPKPGPCAAIPPPAKVKLLVVADKRCRSPECQTANIVGQLQNFFAGLEVTEQDWSTPEGRATYAEHGLRFLPAYIFDDTYKADAGGTQQVARFLEPTLKAGFQRLQDRVIGARHDPNAEICDNAVDDTGDGKADCDDPGCRETLVCRPEIKGSLQVFVMSQCPYGVQALDAMREILTAFGADIAFDVHFIADAAGDGFQSMHGQGEVDEDIRELCAKKLYRDNNKFMDYIWCRNKDIHNAAWQTCATEAGMDVAALETCSTGDQGRQLLREDIALGRTLGFNSSPTWLVDNKRQAGGADPRTIQQAICQGNPQFQGCNAQLSGPPPRPQGGGGGCGG
ncbi:MAG: DsbA family protein [Acidobacteria bacterium]|nr:DsbA family protein [Acidobacteriota bacterium]